MLIEKCAISRRNSSNLKCPPIGQLFFGRLGKEISCQGHGKPRGGGKLKLMQSSPPGSRFSCLNPKPNQRKTIFFSRVVQGGRETKFKSKKQYANDQRHHKKTTIKFEYYCNRLTFISEMMEILKIFNCLNSLFSYFNCYLDRRNMISVGLTVDLIFNHVENDAAGLKCPVGGHGQQITKLSPGFTDILDGRIEFQLAVLHRHVNDKHHLILKRISRFFYFMYAFPQDWMNKNNKLLRFSSSHRDTSTDQNWSCFPFAIAGATGLRGHPVSGK